MNEKVILDLGHDLATLGVCRGDCLAVHSSFKSLGLPDVAPADVIRALIEGVGPEGTIMMPTFTREPCSLRKKRLREKGLL